MGFVQLDIDAPFGEPRNVPVELLADALLHEFDHLVLDRGAFGLGGDHLAFRSAGAQIFERRLVCRLLACEVTRQQAVHHHVRIAADGRREMRIVGECEAVVADVVGRIKGFCHRAYGHRRYGVLLGRVLDLGEKLVQLLGHGTALGGFEDMSEAEDELPEAVQLLLARRVVDAVNHRTFDGAALVGLAFAAELRDAAVGQQHELLDHLVRLLLLLEVNA